MTFCRKYSIKFLKYGNGINFENFGCNFIHRDPTFIRGFTGVDRCLELNDFIV